MKFQIWNISPFNLFQNNEERLIIKNENISNIDIFNIYSYINNKNKENIKKENNITKKTIYNTLVKKNIKD